MKKMVILVAAAVVLAGGWLLFGNITADMGRQAAASVKKAVLDSVVQCCAIEGAYPPNVKYLEENYGLSIDHSRYIVSYEVFASNILPDVDIIEK